MLAFRVRSGARRSLVSILSSISHLQPQIATLAPVPQMLWRLGVAARMLRVRDEEGTMAITTTGETTTDLAPSVLPPPEARAMFDRQARRVLDLSGDEFLARWDAGEYRDLPDTPEGRRVGYLALLIPFGRTSS